MVPDKRPKKKKEKKEKRKEEKRKGIKRPMETSKNDKNVPVLPIPFPIDPNSGLLFCPHISSIPIGRENFSPPILSFVSHTTTIILLPILPSSPPVVFCFCFVLHFLSLTPPPSLLFFVLHFLSLHPLLPPYFFSNLSARCVYVGYNAEHRETFFLLQSSPSLSSSSSCPPLLDGARLDVASAWHYFARLSHVIFHPFTLNVTPNRLIFRSRAGFFFFLFFPPARYLLRPHSLWFVDPRVAQVVYIYI